MIKRMKVLFPAMIAVILAVSSICSVYAAPRGFENARQALKTQQQNSTNNSGSFSDVSKNFWGYQAITDLAKLGVINGYSDNTFKPNAKVTRAEFATMLTKALKLTATDNSQTFTDVLPTSWDFNAVEASKNYLTGFKTSSGTMYFYGDNDAVREDMAVALVKALNLTVESDNGQLQQVFTDYTTISAGLSDYVFTAYKDGLMLGSNGKFAAQGTLTRAEAASLLDRALQKTEKTVVDGNDGSDSSDTSKVVVGNTDQSNTIDTDATLNNLAFNGTLIAGFNANTLIYNVILPSGTTVIPTVTAAVNDAGKATATVSQALGLPGNATVIITAQDGITQKTYTIYFSVSTT